MEMFERSHNEFAAFARQVVEMQQRQEAVLQGLVGGMQGLGGRQGEGQGRREVEREVRDRFFEVEQPEWEKDRW